MAHGKRIHLSVQEPQETWVGSLGWEDPLEEEMATHSRILTGTIPWTEDPGRLQSMGLQKDMTEQQSMSRCLEKARPGCVNRRCSTLPRLTLHQPSPGALIPQLLRGFSAKRLFPESSQGIASIQKNCLTQGYSPSPGRGKLYAMTSWYGDQKAFAKLRQL